jgi:hypothetical protein
MIASFVDAVGVVGGEEAEGAADGRIDGATDAGADGDAVAAGVGLGEADGAAATVNVVVPRACSWSSVENVVQRIS